MARISPGGCGSDGVGTKVRFNGLRSVAAGEVCSFSCCGLESSPRSSRMLLWAWLSSGRFFGHAPGRYARAHVRVVRVRFERCVAMPARTWTRQGPSPTGAKERAGPVYLADSPELAIRGARVHRASMRGAWQINGGRAARPASCTKNNQIYLPLKVHTTASSVSEDINCHACAFFRDLHQVSDPVISSTHQPNPQSMVVRWALITTSHVHERNNGR